MEERALPHVNVNELLTVQEFEDLGLPRMAKPAADYYRAGADDEHTLRENRDAFDRFLIIPRVMNLPMPIKTEVDLKLGNLNLKFAVPFGLSPCAMHKMCHPDGELATVASATKLGMPMILSTLSSTPLEEIATHGGPNACLWMQLFFYKDREQTLKLIRRVETAGFKGIVLTVDTHTFGRRVTDWRNRFYLPKGIVLPNYEGYLKTVEDPLSDGQTPYRSPLFDQVSQLLDLTFSWESLDWLLSVTKLPIIVKGILNGEDADIAIKKGVAAILLSNHGGRQLDDVPGGPESIPDVVRGVNGRVPIIYDGGVRRGSDILKALALGANLVLFARPYVYGLAVGGSEGIGRVFEIFKEELTRSMILAGVRDVSQVPRSTIIHREALDQLIMKSM